MVAEHDRVHVALQVGPQPGPGLPPLRSPATGTADLDGVVERFEEVCEGGPQRGAESCEAIDRGSRLPALEFAYKGPMEACTRSQPFLREARLRLAELPETMPDGPV